MAGATWLMWTVLDRFILPSGVAFILTLVVGVMLLITPIVNHVRIFIAIRRHNRELHDAVSGQNLSAIFKREKKVAMDMFIIVAVLLFCLAPSVAIGMFKSLLAEKYDVLYVWSTAVLFINSTINPVLYLVRNSEMRNAVKSTIKFSQV